MFVMGKKRLRIRNKLGLDFFELILYFRHPDTFDHMTKPDEFYANVIETMTYLDTVLPAGSHVFLTGLANGIYKSLNR